MSASTRLFDRPPEALCILRVAAIGDTCHTVPVVRAIQDAWPETRITWIIGKVEKRLLEGLEDVEFAVLDKSLGRRAYSELRRSLTRRCFPLLLHMHTSARANLASLCVSARIRLGFDRGRSRNFHYLLCNRHVAPRSHMHVMDGLLDFTDALGIERKAPRWDIPIGAADREFAHATIDAKHPSLIISPCAVQRFRNFRDWRAERYAAIADYAATRYGARILLTGGTTEHERGYADRIIASTQCKPIDLIGKTSLKQLLALLQRASAVLSPDSGPAHMCAAVSTPVVGLYATTNPLRAGPYLSRHLVVDKYADALRAELGKSVDEVRWGTRVRNPDAMDLIETADVIEKLDLAFAERKIRPLNAA